jgi:hypothetical protein
MSSKPAMALIYNIGKHWSSDLLNTLTARLLKLSIERLPVGTDAGIAKATVWGCRFGRILWKPQPISYGSNRGITRAWGIACSQTSAID